MQSDQVRGRSILRRFVPLLTVSVLGLAQPSMAAPNADITVIPLGNATIQQGVQELSFRLSSASQNQSVQPLVFIGAQPQLTNAQANDDPDHPPPPGPQVPATLSIEVGGKALPDWVLSQEPTAYVINVATIRGNPEFAAGRLRAKLHLKSNAAAMGVVVLGMPDPLLLDNSNRAGMDGPLVEFARAAKRPEVRDYFQAMLDEFGGRQEDALNTLQRLGGDREIGDVARFARRSLRRLNYLRRGSQLSGNFIEHYRWGLYLQFCGLYRPAYDEFEECRVIFPMYADAQYRAGECFEVIGSDLMGLLPYIDRCNFANADAGGSRFDVLVIIVRAQGETSLPDEEVLILMDHLTIARNMIAAATGNALRIEFSVQLVTSIDDIRLDTYPGGVMGPTADKLEREGWFDGIITIRPDGEGTSGANARVSPPGAGPKGTTLATANQRSRWAEFVEIVYQMIADAGKRSGAVTSLPDAGDAAMTGFGPSPHGGYACRSALRYRASRDDYLGVGVTELPLEESFLRAWRLDAIRNAGGAFDGVPVADGARGKAIVFDSPEILLGSVEPEGPSSRIRATTWVYVPSDQLAQLCIEESRSVGVRVNGREVRSVTMDAAADAGSRHGAFLGIRLKRGWNTIELVTVTGTADSAPSFKASLTTPNGKPIGGLASVHTRPKQDVVAVDDGISDGGERYQWTAVRDDWHRLLPVLDLASAIGVQGTRLASIVDGRGGFVAVDVPGHSMGDRYRSVPREWNAATDRDTELNNVLDWRNEWCMLVDATGNGKRRQLLFVSPEAVDAFVYCLKEDDAAKQRFDGAGPGDRILGRIVAPGPGCDRDLIVFDVWLGEASTWPVDEEDLLSPTGDFVANDALMGALAPAAPLQPTGANMPITGGG